jgi:hypothetical protein
VPATSVGSPRVSLIQDTMLVLLRMAMARLKTPLLISRVCFFVVLVPRASLGQEATTWEPPDQTVWSPSGAPPSAFAQFSPCHLPRNSQAQCRFLEALANAPFPSLASTCTVPTIALLLATQVNAVRLDADAHLEPAGAAGSIEPPVPVLLCLRLCFHKRPRRSCSLGCNTKPFRARWCL